MNKTLVEVIQFLDSNGHSNTDVRKKVDTILNFTNDLKEAIKRNDVRSLDRLIRKGVDIHAKDSDGKTLKEKVDEILEISKNKDFKLNENLKKYRTKYNSNIPFEVIPSSLVMRINGFFIIK